LRGEKDLQTLGTETLHVSTAYLQVNTALGH